MYSLNFKQKNNESGYAYIVHTYTIQMVPPAYQFRDSTYIQMATLAAGICHQDMKYILPYINILLMVAVWLESYTKHVMRVRMHVYVERICQCI